MHELVGVTMKKSHVLCAVCAVLFSLITISANAELHGRLPIIPGGTAYQAYYDDQLDITWAANANINSRRGSFYGQKLWAMGLDIDGVTGWRLPSMDKNGDHHIVDCNAPSPSQAACMDNEYGHLFHYGAGMVFDSGITASSPDPFSNVQSFDYWSGTEYFVPDGYPPSLNPQDSRAWGLHFGGQSIRRRRSTEAMYARTQTSGATVVRP
jgi:hypothetical protein